MDIGWVVDSASWWVFRDLDSSNSSTEGKVSSSALRVVLVWAEVAVPSSEVTVGFVCAGVAVPSSEITVVTI